MSNLDSLCARAWSDVKSPTDPEFENCVPDWRRTLRNRAEAVLRGEQPSTLENVLARFEAKVRGLSGNILTVDDGTTLDVGGGPVVQPEPPLISTDASEPPSVVDVMEHVLPISPLTPTASDDARTVRNSKPTPEDDEMVSKAAKRLGKRGSAKRAATKAPAKKKAKK